MREANTIKVMGILNVTPDSFSDGGKFNDHDSAIIQAHKLINAGADILDVGGESTRPFAKPISTEEELRRVIPVIESIRKKYTLPLSIDTTKAIVAQEAIRAGANLINDISALQHDPNMVKVAQETDVPIIIMHMQKTPADMQIKPIYDNVIEDIIDFFSRCIDSITRSGIDRKRLIIDPGIGFGKTLRHNLLILQHLKRFSRLGLPVLIGHSRKRFIGDIADIPIEAERDLATAVITAVCATKCISMVRVHDVRATLQALKIARDIHSAV